MTGKIAVLHQYRDGDEDETIVAHTYQGSKITGTILIEPAGNNQFVLRWEGSEHAPRYYFQDRMVAIRMADMLLTGFMAGYDKGQEHERNQHPKDQWPNDDERRTRQCQRCGRRDAPPPRNGGARAYE